MADMKPDEVEAMMEYKRLLTSVRNSQNTSGKSLQDQILEKRIEEATVKNSDLKNQLSRQSGTTQTIKATKNRSHSKLIKNGKENTTGSPSDDSTSRSSKSTDNDTEELGDLADRLLLITEVGAKVEEITYKNKDDGKVKTFQAFKILGVGPTTKGIVSWTTVGKENADSVFQWAQ
jgi:hypothetical protein